MWSSTTAHAIPCYTRSCLGKESVSIKSLNLRSIVYTWRWSKGVIWKFSGVPRSNEKSRSSKFKRKFLRILRSRRDIQELFDTFVKHSRSHLRERQRINAQASVSYNNRQLHRVLHFFIPAVLTRAARIAPLSVSPDYPKPSQNYFFASYFWTNVGDQAICSELNRDEGYSQ